MNTEQQIVPYSKQIPLTRGAVATVSYHWYFFLIQWKWHLVLDGKGMGYGVHAFRVKNGKRLTFRMHRFILGLFHGDKREGDHIDNDTLNNTVENLRIANELQTAQNTSSRKNSTSKYLGVSLKITNKKRKPHICWCAQIRVCKKKMHIGIFSYSSEGEIEAAKAYDAKAKEYFGEFANLNFPK